MNNTFYSDDRFSDQSVRTSQKLRKPSRTQQTFTETRNSTKNQRFFHEDPNEQQNSNLTG